MKSVFAVLVTTLALLAGLFALRPFDRASQLLDRAFGATPPWTQVGRLVHDPTTQELSRGEAPRRSFAILAETWRARPEARKVLIIGNSQTMAVSLAPGEPPPTDEEPTWTDLVTRHFAAHGALVYRLSAPGVSYPEALFYVEYLAQHPELRPDVLVLQLNYQSFWNGGIRAGMYELLDDPAFRAAAVAESRSGAPYADAFALALREHDAHTTTKEAPALAPGALVDAAARRWLDGIPGMAARHEQKEDLAELLYRMRIYLLHLRPTTARSIAGTRFIQSRAAIEAILAYCRKAGIRPVLFLAPVNPRLNLYKTDEDRARIVGLVADLEAGGALVAHLEDAIAADLWGRQFNGPDPLHLGRRGHAELARRLIPVIAAALEGRNGVQ
jgi:hypothetical protein